MSQRDTFDKIRELQGTGGPQAKLLAEAVGIFAEQIARLASDVSRLRTEIQQLKTARGSRH